MRQILQKTLKELGREIGDPIFLGLADRETCESLAFVARDGKDCLAASAILGDMLSHHERAMEALGRAGDETFDLAITTSRFHVLVVPLEEVRCYLVLFTDREENLFLARSLLRKHRKVLSGIVAGKVTHQNQEVLSC